MTGLVLMYHRVARLDPDPYGLAVRPERFAEHLEHLRRLGCVVPLEEALAGGRGLRIAITFDDGYVDNATTAAPLLAAAGLPATWFITAGRLEGQHFWWDRLAAALTGTHELPAGVDVEVAGRALWLDLRAPADRDRALRFLHRRLRPLPPDELQAQVEAVVTALGAPPPAADSVTMTTDQLRELAASPLVEVGAHTRTHLQLRDQPERLQREEVLGSVHDLERSLGRPVRGFAYPFGSRSAVGDLAPELVAEAGCRYALTTQPGLAGPDVDPFRQPRVAVYDWPVEELVARLRPWTGRHRSSGLSGPSTTTARKRRTAC